MGPFPYGGAQEMPKHVGDFVSVVFILQRMQVWFDKLNMCGILRPGVSLVNSKLCDISSKAKVHYHTHNSPSLYSNLSLVKAVQTIPFCCAPTFSAHSSSDLAAVRYN